MFYVGCIHRVGIDRHDGVAKDSIDLSQETIV